jgi:hypothetical protein
MHFQLFHLAGGTIEVVNKNNFYGRHEGSFRKIPAIVHNRRGSSGEKGARFVRWRGKK